MSQKEQFRTMRYILTLLTALLFAPLAALQAADAPKAKPNPDQFAGIDPDDGTAPRPDKAVPPKLIANPGSTADYNRAKRTCTGVPSMAVFAADASGRPGSPARHRARSSSAVRTPTSSSARAAIAARRGRKCSRLIPTDPAR